MRADVDVAIIGGGIVGLACAAVLARRGRSPVLLERHARLLTETSSRNSGVVHAGLYYPHGSLKAETCVEGRERLYARAARDGVPHRKLGKLVIAATAGEVSQLERLRELGRQNGAGALRLLDRAELAREAPRLRGAAALLSPESGVVDVHGLADSYRAEAQRHGAEVVAQTEVVGLEPTAHGVRVRTGEPEPFAVLARWVINAAGLAADRVAELAGVDVEAAGWRIRPCKGDYFALSPRIGPVTSRLVYPPPSAAGLGVHLTPDLGGRLRAGPDTEYVAAARYDVDPAKASAFAAAVRRYLPDVRDEDLTPDYAGVRPKLQGPEDGFRDYVLQENPAGIVHLVGIESPGLTAAEALAERVARVVEAA